MKILLYTLYFSPDLIGVGKYSGEMANWFSLKGHDIRVVTAPPFYPSWKVKNGFKSYAWTRSINQKIFIYRCPIWIPSKPNGIKRLLHLTTFILSSLPVMIKQILWRPDLILVVEPSLFCAPTAIAIARLSGAKVWLHVQDFEVDAAFSLGILNGRILRRTVSMFEGWLMRNFDGVSTISKKMVDRLISKGVQKSKTVLFPNWFDMSSFPDDSNLMKKIDTHEINYNKSFLLKDYRTELSIPINHIVALYSGNMGEKQGLELLSQVAELCNNYNSNVVKNNERAVGNYKHSPIIFVFCGDGPGRLDLVNRCRGLTNVRFMDLQTNALLPKLLAFADIHLLPQRSDAADLVMPSKLAGMLASGRSVIAAANLGTELADVVQSCGVVVLPEDPTSMANAVLLLASDSKLRNEFGEKGKAYAKKHMDREIVLECFERRLIIECQ
jgi:colanic acid biosynthesis glycosyl transferase WcaI